MKKLLAGVLAAALLALGGCGTDSAAASAAASAGVSSGAEASGSWQVYCFQAGKADAILLYSGSAAVLIDTGESGFGKTIVSYLQNAGIGTLDALILTHFDQDHVGGAAKVLSSVTVKAVYTSDCPKSSKEYAKYLAALDSAGLTAVTVREDTSFTLDGAVFSISPPRRRPIRRTRATIPRSSPPSASDRRAFSSRATPKTTASGNFSARTPAAMTF
jgi:competence protein ComEC